MVGRPEWLSSHNAHICRIEGGYARPDLPPRGKRNFARRAVSGCDNSAASCRLLLDTRAADRASAARVGPTARKRRRPHGGAGGAASIPRTTVPDGTDPAEVDRIRAVEAVRARSGRPADISCVCGAR
jgi:hypothetical protein